MGLLDQLDNNGTTYNPGVSSTSLAPSFGNSLSKVSSIRHKRYSLRGYPSINGALIGDYFPGVVKGFGLKPLPSLLDGSLNGNNPTGPLSDPLTPSINNSFSCGVYKNCAPENGASHI